MYVVYTVLQDIAENEKLIIYLLFVILGAADVLLWSCLCLLEYVQYVFQCELRFFTKKNAIKITRGNNKNCFRKLKVTKAYNFDLFFSPYVYKWEETGLLKKKEMKYTSWVVLVLRVTENDS